MNETYLTPLLNDYAAAPSPAVMAKLVEGYLPLSRAIARKFSGRGVEQEDLEQVAAMALMKAIERFEPQRAEIFHLCHAYHCRGGTQLPAGQGQHAAHEPGQPHLALPPAKDPG